MSRRHLVGGDLIGSARGWSLVEAMRRVQDHMKRDERDKVSLPTVTLKMLLIVHRIDLSIKFLDLSCNVPV